MIGGIDGLASDAIFPGFVFAGFGGALGSGGGSNGPYRPQAASISASNSASAGARAGPVRRDDNAAATSDSGWSPRTIQKDRADASDRLQQCGKDENLHVPISRAFALRTCVGRAQGRRSGTSDASRWRARCATTMKDLEAHESGANRNLIGAFWLDDQVQRETLSSLIGTARALQMGGIYRAARSRRFANPIHGAILFVVSVSLGGQVNYNVIWIGCRPSAKIGIRK